MSNFDIFDELINRAPICPFGSFCSDQCKLYNKEKNDCGINLALKFLYTIASEEKTDGQDDMHEM